MNKQKKFERILNEHKALIFKVAKSYTNGSEALKDLSQEIALQLWSSLDSYDENLKLSTWLYRVALNTAISSLRKRSTIDKHHIFDNDAIQFAADEAEVFNERDELDRLLKQLEVYDRSLIILHLEGLSHQEIAEIMNMSVSNVGTRLQRAKHTLTKIIGG
jgi:RNA polymerase sigma factor (sigma-70 family)